MVAEALACCRHRIKKRVEALRGQLKEKLIDEPTTHMAVLGAAAASSLGLPVEPAQTSSREWSLLWALWALLLDWRLPRGEQFYLRTQTGLKRACARIGVEPVADFELWQLPELATSADLAGSVAGVWLAVGDRLRLLARC